MTIALHYQLVTLVEAKEADAIEHAARLQTAMSACGFTLRPISENDFPGYIQQQCATGEAPVAVLLGESISRVATIAATLRRQSCHSYVVFLQPEHRIQDFRRKLQHVPLAGVQWRIQRAPAEDLAEQENLAEQLSIAAQDVRRRLQLQNTLDRANTEINAARASGRRDYHRLVISDHYLMNFLAHTQDAIVALDLDSRVIYWSAGAERLFDRQHLDAVGLHARELPFWSDTLQNDLRQLERTGNTCNLQTLCRLAKGDITVDMVLSAVRDDLGNSIGSSLVIRDISERQRQLEAEREAHSRTTRMLDSERQRLRSFFKQAPGFMAILMEPLHIFELANDAFDDLVGHRELLGKPLREALPEMQEQGLVALLDKVYETGEAYVARGEPIKLLRLNGKLETVYLDLVYQPIFDDDGSVIGIFAQGADVTETKLAQDELRRYQHELESIVAERTAALERSQAALQKSQKLEAVGKLTGGVAHDFNNVLQIISGNLQLLQPKLEGTTAERYVNSAVDAVSRGAKLSSQLLAFARRQPLQPVSVNLARVLRSMDDLLRRALDETIEIETVVGGGLWNTMVDPNQLENVILNLSINARDAMPDGGKLTLELGNAMLDDQYVLHHANEISAGQYVMLAISDTGTGMTEEVMERAFDPFFTTKKEGEGTGLGLSMAYGFIKQSDGHIKIYSETGNGTTFKIYLPRTQQPEVERQEKLDGPVIGGTETVLVVEDDPAVRETAVRTLQDLGYQVVKASDGQSALNVLQSGFAIDLLFTDVVMPGPVTSPELARQAKQILPDIAVLFTSGYTQNAIVHGGRLDVGVELLSKPYRREDLARKVRLILANRQQVSQSQQAKHDAAETQQDRSVSMRVLVVEDNADSQLAICELLEMLGHHVMGVVSAEEALDMLTEHSFDLLFTDVNLPGMPGTVLAETAVQTQPKLKVIIASGYGAALNCELNVPARILPKPFSLNALKEALTSFD